MIEIMSRSSGFLEFIRNCQKPATEMSVWRLSWNLCRAEIRKPGESLGTKIWNYTNMGIWISAFFIFSTITFLLWCWFKQRERNNYWAEVNIEFVDLVEEEESGGEEGGELLGFFWPVSAVWFILLQMTCMNLQFPLVNCSWAPASKQTDIAWAPGATKMENS